MATTLQNDADQPAPGSRKQTPIWSPQSANGKARDDRVAYVCGSRELRSNERKSSTWPNPPPRCVDGSHRESQRMDRPDQPPWHHRDPALVVRRHRSVVAVFDVPLPADGPGRLPRGQVLSASNRSVPVWNSLPSAAAILIGLTQLIELPDSMCALVSPKTAALRTDLSSLGAPDLASLTEGRPWLLRRPTTLSVYPPATRREIALLLCGLAVFVVRRSCSRAIPDCCSSRSSRRSMAPAWLITGLFNGSHGKG